MSESADPSIPGPSIPQPQPQNPGGVPPHFHDDYRIQERNLIPNGSYVSVVPDWAAPEGTIVFYLNGSDFRLYRMLDGTWQVIKKITLPLSESDLSFSDVTTLDVNTSKHGLAPKAPNDTTKFLRGDASWAVPPQTVSLKATGAASAQSITISGLDLNTDEQYLVIIRFNNGNSTSAGTSEQRLLLNGDTGANYDYAYQMYSNLTGGSRNDAAVTAASVIKLSAELGSDTDGEIILWLTSVQANVALLKWSLVERDTATKISTVDGSAFYNGAANITSLQIGALMEPATLKRGESMFINIH